MNFALLAAFLLDGSQAPSVFYDGVLQERATSTAGITNIVSTNDAITVSVSNLEARIGMTSTPIFAESDPVWTAASGLYALVSSLPYTGSNMVEQYITSNTNMISGVIPAPPPGWRRLRWWFSGFGTNISSSAEVVMQVNGYTNTSFYSLVVQRLYFTPYAESRESTNYPGLKIGRTWGPSAANSNNLNYFEVTFDNPWNTNFPSHTSSFYSKIKPGNGLVPINSQTASEMGYHVYSVPGVLTSFVVRYDIDGKFLTNSMWGWSYLP